MIEIEIPDFGELSLEHLVLDYNGTIAIDGYLVPGIDIRLQSLSELLNIHVVTADTFGVAKERLANTPCKVVVLQPEGQDVAKADYVKKLGSERTVAIGNGRNDTGMLEEARLGIAVLLEEGTAAAAIGAADLVMASIEDALDILTEPRRLVATLRR